MRLADLALVAVGGGGVDVPVAGAQRRLDRGDGLVGRGLEDAEPEGRDLDAVVQGEGGAAHGLDARSGERGQGGTDRSSHGSGSRDFMGACEEQSFMEPGTSASRSGRTPPSSSPPTPSSGPSPPACAARTCGATAGSSRSPQPTPIGHEYVGVVEQVGDAVTTVQARRLRRRRVPAQRQHLPGVPQGHAGELPARGRLRRLPGREDPHPERRRHPARHPRAAGRRPDPQPAGPLRRDVHRLARRGLRRRRPGSERRRRRRRRGRAERGARRGAARRRRRSSR